MWVKGNGNRIKQHLTDKNHYCFNKRFNGKIRKIREAGYEPIVKKILINLTEEQAYQYEEYLIQKFGRAGFEDNGSLMNILLSCRPYYLKGEEHPLYGIPKSEEHKRKIKEANKKYYRENPSGKPWNKGLILIDEKYKKGGRKNKGRKISDEHIEAIRQSRLNKEQSDFQKQQVRKANSAKWEVTDPDGNTFIIENLRQFAKDNNVDQGNLSRGKSKGFTAKKL